MTENRKIGCGLLLMAAVLLLTFTLLPGQAYARYCAGDSWSAVVCGTTNAIPILTANNRSITVTVSNSEAPVLQKLNAAGVYEAFSENSLTVDYGTENITISLGEALPPAGTYRLVIPGTDETEEVVVVFFVNYSAG